MTKEQAIQAKANWLSQCLEFGWKHSELDNLSEVWDRFKDEYGNMRSSTPSLNAGSLEEAAEEYLNEKPDWANDQNHFHTTRSIYLSDMKAAYLAGAHNPSRPSLDIDKVVDELRAANPYQQYEDGISGVGHGTWEECCDKLKELLNQKEGK